MQMVVSCSLTFMSLQHNRYHWLGYAPHHQVLAQVTTIFTQFLDLHLYSVLVSAKQDCHNY